MSLCEWRGRSHVLVQQMPPWLQHLQMQTGQKIALTIVANPLVYWGQCTTGMHGCDPHMTSPLWTIRWSLLALPHMTSTAKCQSKIRLKSYIKDDHWCHPLLSPTVTSPIFFPPWRWPLMKVQMEHNHINEAGIMSLTNVWPISWINANKWVLKVWDHHHHHHLISSVVPFGVE